MPFLDRGWLPCSSEATSLNYTLSSSCLSLESAIHVSVPNHTGSQLTSLK